MDPLELARFLGAYHRACMLDANGSYRAMTVWVECYEVVERLPEIVDAAREAMARLRHEYMARLYIALRVPPQKHATLNKRNLQKRQCAPVLAGHSFPHVPAPPIWLRRARSSIAIVNRRTHQRRHSPGQVFARHRLQAAANRQ